MSGETPDFSTRLHDLRTAELRRLPVGARTVLHGGAAGAWYFEWFDKNYPGDVERHIGVEAFADRPPDLPANVQWLAHTLGDMESVPSGSVDMVFGGQVIEHLWPQDVTGFLLESHRVLRPDGMLVLDSPNRRVTEAIEWRHPEHTAELAVEEIQALLELAGFEVEELRGVLLGYDSSLRAFLDLEDLRVPWEERAGGAAARPEDSFVWWLRARREERAPDEGRLHEVAMEQSRAFRARRLSRLSTHMEVRRAVDQMPCVHAGIHEAGLMLSGPTFPLDRGTWTFSFFLSLDMPTTECRRPVVRLELISAGGVEHASREVSEADLDATGAWTKVDLRVELPRMVMGVDVRVFSTGATAVSVQAAVVMNVGDQGIVIQPSMGSFDASRMPEPRTVELLEMLHERALRKFVHVSRRWRGSG